MAGEQRQLAPMAAPPVDPFHAGGHHADRDQTLPGPSDRGDLTRHAQACGGLVHREPIVRLSERAGDVTRPVGPGAGQGGGPVWSPVRGSSRGTLGSVGLRMHRAAPRAMPAHAAPEACKATMIAAGQAGSARPASARRGPRLGSRRRRGAAWRTAVPGCRADWRCLERRLEAENSCLSGVYL